MNMVYIGKIIVDVSIQREIDFVKGDVILSNEELKVFYLLDEKNYLVEKNSVLSKILNVLECEYSNEDIQKYIDKLISWYSIKYSDKFLESLFNKDVDTDTTILDIMDIETLYKSYGAFEEELFRPTLENNGKVILQKHLIVMAGWGLIYNKNSNPEFGYYRATKLLNDFNSVYSWNLSSNVYLPVLKRDYSPNREENRKLLEKKSKYIRHEKRRSSLFSR